jgi:hypothetical protein
MFLTIGIEATISNNFYQFLVVKHGKEFANSVARFDIGIGGSFGGGNHKPGTKTKSEYLRISYLWISYSISNLITPYFRYPMRICTW